MNQQIVEYLRANKDRYTQESLITQLRNVGQSENDIKEAADSVYGIGEAPPIIFQQTPVKYAGFWIRSAALIIDMVITFVVWGRVQSILVIAVILFSKQGNLMSMETMSMFIRMLYVIYVLAVFAYFVIMTYVFQGTIGKKLLGIEVRSVQTGGKVSIGSVVMRETVGKMISVCVVCIGFLMAGFTTQKQALHDKISGTVVVYKYAQQSAVAKVIFWLAWVCLGVIVAFVVFHALAAGLLS